jgi:hypothetical protein
LEDVFDQSLLNRKGNFCGIQGKKDNFKEVGGDISGDRCTIRKELSFSEKKAADNFNDNISKIYQPSKTKKTVRNFDDKRYENNQPSENHNLINISSEASEKSSAQDN